MLYNGSPKRCIDHFAPFGLHIEQFCNPADKMIKLAALPGVVARNAGFFDMVHGCTTKLTRTSALQLS